MIDYDNFLGDFAQYYNGKICIIIPCQNRNDFLRLSLPSWFSQTYHKFEIVLIDYNSTNPIISTVEPICQKYKRSLEINPNNKDRYNEYSDVTIFEVKDVSEWNMSHAINYGVVRTTSDIISIAGCDTTPVPEYLETVVNLVSDSVIPSVFCGRLTFPRHIWHELNGYNEICVNWGWEDCDWRMRLKNSGKTLREVNVLLCPSVTHMALRGDYTKSSRDNREKCINYAQRFGLIGNYNLLPGQDRPIQKQECDTNIVTYGKIKESLSLNIATYSCYAGTKNEYVFFIHPSCSSISFSEPDKIYDIKQRKIRQSVWDILEDIKTDSFLW